MYYYPHHIGDFIADTARLSDSQCMAYLRLIWHYYDTEKPLENDPDSLAFKIGSSSTDVALILKHYFVLDGNLWRKSRCDNVISEYHEKADKARNSANARWKNANAMRTHNERNANEYKIDANQEPITNNQYINTLVPTERDRVPVQDLITLFNNSFTTLPEVKILTDTRRSALRKRWLENEDMQTISRWKEFFEYIKKSDWLMGRITTGDGRCFSLTFDWMVKPSNFVKIREGNYHK